MRRAAPFSQTRNPEGEQAAALDEDEFVVDVHRAAWFVEAGLDAVMGEPHGAPLNHGGR
ncbi:hypothetical protein [Brevundimonas sp. MF30-B]|uniref:hypothetical protein n=1 Tax=unclassified Brevundimonas TaxID=2622653 RepID=UPI00352E3EC5